MRLATLLVVLLLAAPAAAQTPGDCQLGSAQADLNISDVQARLFTTGSLFFGNTTTAGNGYIVPKATATLPTPLSPIFAAGIWVGGMMNGELRVAGSSYNRFEFWPGPLNEDGTLPNPEDCSAYDRIWLVDVFDVQQYEETGTAPADLAEWPAELGAPVVDGDGVEGNYDLEGGDRPAVYGHQTAFWVMNDVGNDHWKTLTQPIGLEVRVTAFSSVEADLAQQTLYRYELANRNSQPFEEARFSLFADSDLGDAGDDAVGTDTTRDMAFVYNWREPDDHYGVPPAVGYDLLNGAGSAIWFLSEDTPAGDPDDGVGMYNFMQGTWGNGSPMREFGDGYAQAQGDITLFVFPGDPVTQAFWSEENVDGEGTRAGLGDRRHLLSSPPFTLAPGESRTFDLAILFGQGAGRLDSITELRGVSDAVEARYDSDLLFAPGPQPPPSGSLPTPALLGPEEGTMFVDEDVTLSWTAVPGAEHYRVEIATDPDFYDTRVLYADEAGAPFDMVDVNEVVTYYWRVKAIGFGLTSSAYSALRSFTFYRYEFDLLGNGDGIIETSYPGVEVCPEEGDPGCEDYGGNTVWLNPNATDDYVLASSYRLDRLIWSEIIGEDDFELRFTEACATFGGCLGAYIHPDEGEIVSVPFELWNIRDEEVSTDDVRLIPMIRTQFGTDPLTDWAHTFTDTAYLEIEGDILEVGVTDRIFFMMPDRPNGYALFEEAANAFGGPGAVYDPESDGDTQVDPTASGNDCSVQGWYVDFCYRSEAPRSPIGGSEGLVVADLAGDGTTPPSGTTVRFVTNDRLLPVSAEDDVLAAPQAFALEAAYPNPFRASATVGYRLEQAGDVRLAVYDVLGRRVAVLAEGPKAAGAHRATFDGSRLASGVYLVVLEAEGQRQTQKVMLVR